MNTLWVSPTDSDLLVVGGKHHHKSTNGGASFTQISDGDLLMEEPHPDQHCIVEDPRFGSVVNGTTNKRVYVCNDGGVFKTDDITTANTGGTNDPGGWESLNESYQTTQYYGVAGRGANGLTYGGTQDNGTLALQGDTINATLPFGGDGGYAAITPDGTRCHGTYIHLMIHRSNCSGGATMIYCGPGGTDPCWDNPPNGTNALTDAGSDATANFVSPFVLDPNNSNRIFAGGISVWKTNDAHTVPHPSWFRIRPAGTGCWCENQRNCGRPERFRHCLDRSERCEDL